MLLIPGTKKKTGEKRKGKKNGLGEKSVFEVIETHCTLRGKIGPKHLKIENRENSEFWRSKLVFTVGLGIVDAEKPMFVDCLAKNRVLGPF